MADDNGPNGSQWLGPHTVPGRPQDRGQTESANVKNERRNNKLNVCADRLREARSKFLAGLPQDDQIALGPSPNIQQLLSSVEKAHAEWSSRRATTRLGKVQMKTEDWAARLNDHQNLLSVIPSNDKYVAIVVGSISVLVKAAVNHQDIGQAIVECLDEVHEDLDYWKRKMEVYQQNEFMRDCIIELYVIVFEMFTEIFSGWSKSRWQRFKNSFDPTWITKAINEKRDKVATLKLRLENEANLDMGKVVRNIREDQVTRADLQRMLDNVVMIPKDAFNEVFARLLPQIQVSSMLPRITDPTSNNLALIMDSVEPTSILDPHLPVQDTCQIQPRIDLSFVTDITARKAQGSVIEQCHPVLIRSEMKGMLGSWFDGAINPKLWIEAQADGDVPSQNTALAVALASVLTSLNMPTISHFCVHMIETKPASSFSDTALLAMVLDLCDQLWQMISLDFADWLPDDAAKLQAIVDELVKNRTSITIGLKLLSQLMHMRPSSLKVVIDNFNILEDIGNREHMMLLQRLMEILTLTENSESYEVDDEYRICFTTNGSSDVLGNWALNDSIEHILNPEVRGADEELSFDV